MTKRMLIPLAIFCFLTALGTYSIAGTIKLSQTGQTTCWDTNGNVIPCSGTGQDGDIAGRCCVAKSQVC